MDTVIRIVRGLASFRCNKLYSRTAQSCFTWVGVFLSAGIGFQLTSASRVDEIYGLCDVLLLRNKS